MRTLCEARRRWSDAVEMVGPECWVPALPPHFVSRARLEQRVDEALGSRLVVVTGMAGAGKSTLLAGWARGRGRGTTAWLGLEAADNESARFWSELVGALRVIAPRMGDNVLMALSAGVSDRRVAEMLVGEMATIGHAVVVLDDLHVLTEVGLVDAVGYLAGHVPSNVHLVVATRQPSGLGLHRLRLSGDLAEIHPDELRFTHDEAARLLSTMVGGAMPPGDIAALMARTEGWAAGLRLAGLALIDHQDPSVSLTAFGGNYVIAAEYFQHEVLADQPPDIVEFMIETSVLETMTPRLCHEVSGRADAERILEDLARGQGFVVQMDATGGRYRYHHLFAEFLRRRLDALDPEVARQAHLRAADWLERNGDDRAAFDHLVQGDACDQAFALGAAAVVAHLQHRQPLDGLLPGELPDTYIEQDPWRMYVVATALLGQLRASDAARWLRRLTRSLAGSPDEALLRGRAEMLWTIHYDLLLDAAGVLEHRQRVDKWLGAGGHLDLNLAPALVARHPWLGTIDAAIAGLLPVVAARAHVWLGQPDQARAIMDDSARNEHWHDDIAHLAVRASIALGDGQLRDAYSLAQTALDVAGSQRGVDAVTSLAARLTLAGVLRQRDLLDAAQHQLTEAGGVSQDTGLARWSLAITCEEVQLLMDQGRDLDALNRIGHLRHVDASDALPELLRQRLDQLEIRCRLALGDLEGATVISNSITPALRTTEILGRLDLCAGRPNRAESRLSAAPDRSHPTPAEIERLVLLARAQLQLGKRPKAADTLRRAVEQGRPDDHIRVFVDHGPELLSLLRGLAGRYPDTYLAQVVDHAQQIPTPSGNEPSTQIVEPLTGREREVLGHLPSHLTQREIAANMYVSLNTVKTHSKAVYRKLGAGSRAQAVQLARQHRLL